jgi:hypothetical protein
MTISRQLSSVEIMIDRRQPEIVKYFKYLGSMTTNDIHVQCIGQIKSRIATARAESNKKNSFHQQIGLKFKDEIGKVLYLEHTLYGAETWALQEVDQKYL